MEEITFDLDPQEKGFTLEEIKLRQNKDFWNGYIRGQIHQICDGCKHLYCSIRDSNGTLYEENICGKYKYCDNCENGRTVKWLLGEVFEKGGKNDKY